MTPAEAIREQDDADDNAMSSAGLLESGQSAVDNAALSIDAASMDTQELQQRRGPYFPNVDVKRRCKGSIHLAFLSHGCFITASLFYIKLAFVEVSWLEYTKANEDPDGALIDSYVLESKSFYTLGAAFFVLVGALDMMRYCDCMNAFMILAGAAGVVSGLSEDSRKEAVWDCVSVHLYLLEAYNLLHREHDYEGHASIFRLGDVCFLLGSILDVLGSYLELAGIVGIRAAYTDMVACFLWLICSLIDWSAEIYFLRKHLSSTDSADGLYDIECY